MFGFKTSKRKNPINKPVTESVIVLGLLAAAEAMHAGSAFMPSYFTIKTLALDGNQEQIQQKISNLRSGYLPAVGFGLGLGAIVSFFAKSPIPLMMSTAASGFMIITYEQALPPERRLLCGNNNPSTPELRPLDMFMFGSALL